MSAPSRKAKRNPRRKAGKASRRRSSRKLTFNLAIEAQKMRVTYTPNASDEYGLFEFRSPYTPPKRIPLSSSGYLAHFVPMTIVEADSDLKDFARTLAGVLLNIATKNYDARQLPLF